jgi:hypothetical protein
MTRVPKRSRLVRVSLVLAVTIPAVAMWAIAISLSATASSTTKQIAVSTLSNDFRTVLTAIRGAGGDGVLPATVRITAYERSGDQWKSLGHQTVGDPDSWFWNVVSGPGAICRFSTSGLAPYPVEVRLLVSDSIGCSPATYNFRVDKYGHLVPG